MNLETGLLHGRDGMADVVEFAASAASNSDPRFNTGSVVEEAKMTQGAPTKLLVNRMLHETVQVAHHD